MVCVWTRHDLFFDGLANSMLVGKTLAGPAEKQGVPREKIAYIVDSTSSSVACIALSQPGSLTN